MLWHIELKFKIWQWFTVLQIKFECCQFASIFVGFMPLLEVRILEIQLFTYWAEILRMTLFYCTIDQIGVSSICVNFCGKYAPFGTHNTENTQFSALFSYMLGHIELKFCIWLCFTVIQIKFECRQFASIFMGVVPLFELRILEVQFSALFSFMLWHIELKDQVWVSSLCVHPF